MYEAVAHWIFFLNENFQILFTKQNTKFCTHSWLCDSAAVFWVNSEGLIYVSYSRINPQTQQCFQFKATVHLRSHCKSRQTASDMNDWPSFTSSRVFRDTQCLRITETVSEFFSCCVFSFNCHIDFTGCFADSDSLFWLYRYCRLFPL